MNLKRGSRVIVKGTHYEVLHAVEEADSSIPPNIRSYTALYLHRVGDQSDEPSLVVQLKNNNAYTVTKEKVRRKLKESDFKVVY